MFLAESIFSFFSTTCNGFTILITFIFFFSTVYVSSEAQLLRFETGSLRREGASVIVAAAVEGGSLAAAIVALEIVLFAAWLDQSFLGDFACC